MLRGIARAGVVLGVAGGMLLPALASNATEIAAIPNPVTGCTTYVYGPTVTITTLPTPGVHSAGGFGESVACP